MLGHSRLSSVVGKPDACFVESGMQWKILSDVTIFCIKYYLHLYTDVAWLRYVEAMHSYFMIAVVIKKDKRGHGYGRVLMQKTEEYVLK